MKQELREKALLWWRMLSPQEKQDAFMELLRKLYQFDAVWFPDNHTIADMISDGMGDIDSIAPLWESDGEPILKVGR